MNQQTKDVLKKAAQIHGEGCVTVTLNTHRTAPDCLKDPILLKELLKQAESRLSADHGAKIAQATMAKLNTMAGSIDHAHNLESLVLFANTEFSAHVKLPVAVVDRVTIDDTFATRDLYRALHREAEYYVLLLNRVEARLFQAINGKVEAEVRGDFPVKNSVAGSDAAKIVSNRDFTALVEEFFNRVDKALVKVINEEPLPVVLATESRNVDHYGRIADKKEFLKANFNPSHDDLTPHHLVEEAWKAYAPVVKSKYDQRTDALETAISAGRLLTDHNDIWRALQEGRGGTIFVKQGLFQPAMLNNGQIELLPGPERKRKGAVDDIIDEMIERNKAFGGDAVFVHGDELDRFNGLALVTRY
ncbi:MAG: hypothetical protein K8H89_00835 [Flavobacteriales bacterium]|jgi:hypothetical protein|nr:hypothetical protein [Flavobacteriales bacterium]MCB0757916.1 hypothetical protein [Flavobacteriales bacterium]